MSTTIENSAELAKLALFLGAYAACALTPGPRTLAVSNCAMLNGPAHAFTMVVGLVGGTAVLGVEAAPCGESLSRLEPLTQGSWVRHCGASLDDPRCADEWTGRIARPVTTMGQGAKANHLAYLGDSTIGTKTNVGAGTITCNYDGEKKHRTIIGNNVFVGSNSTIVAPVTIADGSYIAAGSAVTADVPAGALAIGRSRQEIKDGWVGRRKEEKAKS